MEGVHGYPGSHWKPPLGKFSHRIAPADDRVCMQTKKRWKSIILAGRFAGRGGAPVQYQAHRPMEGDQGYSGSHWLPPPGKYCGR